MKTKLLILSLLIISTISFSQVAANQVDDFEDGTTQNWAIGNPGGAQFPPANITTGGPAGSGDNFLEYTSSGVSFEAGSKMVIFNSNQQWAGNYTSLGIVGIRFDVQVLTNDLNLRIAMFGSGTRICTTNAIPVVAGNGWTTVTIPISESDFSLIVGSTIASALTNVNIVRILSSSSPTWDDADEILSTLRVDNITALTTLGVNNVVQQNDFKISPNPSKSRLNLLLPPSTTTVKLEVFDVLGKKIISKDVSNISSSIDVSKWNNGVYLVRITSSNGTQTKRFIKQ